MPHQLRKRHERRQIGMGISSHTHPGAGRPLEHPCWNLKPAVHIGTAQTTTKNNLARPLDSFVNANPKTKPWMPPVKQFAKVSSVGVLKPRCTTQTDHTRASTGSHQSSSQRAPRRGKTGTDSPYERGQVGEQVTSAILMYFANRRSQLLSAPDRDEVRLQRPPIAKRIVKRLVISTYVTARILLDGELQHWRHMAKSQS